MILDYGIIIRYPNIYWHDMTDLVETTSKDIIEIIPRLMQVFVAQIKNCDESNFPVAHFRILGMLMHKPMKMSDLAKIQRISKASISESVKLLVDKGWITKTHDPGDKRIIVLKVSADGREILRNMENRLASNLSRQLRQTSDEDLQSLHRSLQLLRSLYLKET